MKVSTLLERATGAVQAFPQRVCVLQGTEP